MEDKLVRIKSLIIQREQIDNELASLITGATVTASQRKCKVCGQLGHNSKTCPTKQEGAT
jgi:Zinc knuckle